MQEIAKQYPTSEVERHARGYAAGYGINLDGTVSRPYGGGDGRWDFGGYMQSGHGSKITVCVEIADGMVLRTYAR